MRDKKNFVAVFICKINSPKFIQLQRSLGPHLHVPRASTGLDLVDVDIVDTDKADL